MNKKPKVSLIVPVYNAQDYIYTALESIEKQTFKDFEVILVNDGSLDSSEKIIKNFIKDKKNFILLNQDNKGLSGARNSGIRKAKGKYLAFMDSDDVLHPDFLEALYKLITKNDADISYCNFKIYFSNSGLNLYMPFTAKDSVLSSKEALGRVISDITLHNFAWNKMYKKSLFTDNGIKYEDMFYEDLATTPKLFYYAKKVAVTSLALYYYRRHKQSMIAFMTYEKTNDFLLSLGMIRNFLEEKGVYKEYRSRFRVYAARIRQQVNYCILNEHFVKGSLHGLAENLKNASIAVKLFKSDKYVVSEDPPILPYYIKDPADMARKRMSS